MIKDKSKNMAIMIAMISVMAVGSISAYFTATDSQTNEFTVGDVIIEQWENGKHENVKEDDIVPNQEIEKKPTVKNTGKNDAYIFTAIAVPKKVVKVARTADGSGSNSPLAGEGPAVGDGGNSNPAVDGSAVMTQLFQLNGKLNDSTTLGDKSYAVGLGGKTSNAVSDGIGATYDTSGAAIPVFDQTSNADVWTGNDSWNQNWTLVDVNGVYSEYDNHIDLFKTNDSTPVNLADHYNIYVFAYGKDGKLTKLPKGNTTESPVIDSVTVANVVNINDVLGNGNNNMDYDAKFEGTTPQILVKSFAIQSDNVTDNDSTSTSTLAVWKILNNQDAAYRALADQLADLPRDWWADPVDSTDRSVNKETTTQTQP